MQVVAKTPHIDLRITGEIPAKILRALEEEYGEALQVVGENEDELVDVTTTDWYRETKKGITPGDVLRTYRENAGLTQTALGQKIGGVPRQHISNMENGKRPIGKENAKKLAAALGTDYRAFL
jgi:DNA-binding XRE family transcriptional regulator